MSKVSWGSCCELFSPPQVGKRIIDMGINDFVMLGDMPYTSVVYLQTWGGGSVSQHSGDDPSLANFQQYHLMATNAPGYKDMLDNINVHYMPDDHEYPGDNWDHTVTQAETGVGAMTGATQTTVDAAFTAAWGGIDTYYTWPSNTDVDAVAQAPSEAAAADANYPPRYYRFTVGDIECFVLDCISHRDPLRDAASASKTMLGTNQKAWLKARLKASVSTYKVIFCGKKTFNTAVNDNGDTWAPAPNNGAITGYENERDEILAFIHAGTDWAVPGGVVWCVGDRHTPEVMATYTSASTDPDMATTSAYDHLCVCACPFGRNINSNQGTPGTATIEVNPTWGLVFGVVEDFGTYLEIRIHRSSNGKVAWKGRVNAGENKLIYAPMDVAI